MSRIGGAWLNSREQDGEMKMYYSLSFDEALMPFVIDKSKKIVMSENKNKGDNEKAPDMIIEAYIPKPKTREKEMITDEEIPF